LQSYAIATQNKVFNVIEVNKQVIHAPMMRFALMILIFKQLKKSYFLKK